MAWCKVSSLTAAVAGSLEGLHYPASRTRILSVVEGVTLEGWNLRFFLASALKMQSYNSLREVMEELENWLQLQG